MMAQFLLLVIPEVQGRELFDHPLYTQILQHLQMDLPVVKIIFILYLKALSL